MKVEILGASGCATCESVKQDVERVVEDMGKVDEVEVVKVTDPAEFASYGVMSTPALVANGEVKFKGTIPSEEEIREVLS